MRCRACNTILEQEELFDVRIGKLKDNKYVSKIVLNDMCFHCLAEAEINDEVELAMREELKNSFLCKKLKKTLDK